MSEKTGTESSPIQRQLDRIDKEINVNRELCNLLGERLFPILASSAEITTSTAKESIYLCSLEESLARFSDFVSYTNKILDSIHSRIQL